MHMRRCRIMGRRAERRAWLLWRTLRASTCPPWKSAQCRVFVCVCLTATSTTLSRLAWNRPRATPEFCPRGQQQQQLWALDPRSRFARCDPTPPPTGRHARTGRRRCQPPRRSRTRITAAAQRWSATPNLWVPAPCSPHQCAAGDPQGILQQVETETLASAVEGACHERLRRDVRDMPRHRVK